MKYEQIIKALGCCNRPTREGHCKERPYCKIDGRCTAIMLDETIDLINRKKAEVERLNVKIKAMCGEANSYKLENTGLLQKLQQAKSEAIKEFAERLRKYLCLDLREGISVVTVDDINKIVKEMAGEKE